MKISEEMIQKMIELRQSGKGVTEIGRILGIGRDTVSKYLKARGYNTDRNPLYKNIFRIIDTEEKAYWLGFLYADGYVSKYNQIEVSLTLKDEEHLYKLKKFVNTNTNIIKDDHRVRLLFCSKEMAQDLANLGCVNNKSLVLTFPTKEQVPDNLLRHFLRGYVDGDGCLCCTSKTQQFSITSTKEFFKGMLERTGWRETDCNYYSSGKAITWRSHQNVMPQYLHFLYDDSKIYLNRKYEKYKTLTAV